MPLNFQFGYEHYLHLAVDISTPTNPIPKAFTQRPPGDSPAIHFNNAPWQEYANVRTVTVGGSANSVDITTRDEARSGFSSEVDVTTTGEMTFEVRYKRRTDAGAIQDPIFEALLKAWLGKLEIAAVDLDGPLTRNGAQGLAGNWTVGFSNQKEVQGVVIANLTLKLSSYPNWIRAGDTSGTAFVAVT